jgi:hypothetical protein
LNALLVFRLLTRSPSEEAQGKLAAALAKTVPRSASRSGSRGAKTSRTQKGIEDTASQSAIGATVVSTRQSLEVTRKGNQQPGDYKAWLFTDDWYTPTGSTGNQDPTSSSKRSNKSLTQSPRRLVSPPTARTSVVPVSTSITGAVASVPKTQATRRTATKSSRASASGGGSGSTGGDGLESDSIFQEQVYDLMSQERDSAVSDQMVNPTAAKRQLAPTSLEMLSSTLTDDEDDLISVTVSEMTATTVASQSQQKDGFVPPADPPPVSVTPPSASYSQECAGMEGNDCGNEEDEEEDLDELRSIAQDSHLITDPRGVSRRHRLPTVLEHPHDGTAVGVEDLQQVSVESYNHIDSRDKLGFVHHLRGTSGTDASGGGGIQQPNPSSARHSSKGSLLSPSHHRKKRHTTTSRSKHQPVAQSQQFTDKGQTQGHDYEREVKQEAQVLHVISTLISVSAAQTRTETESGIAAESMPSPEEGSSPVATSATSKLRPQLSLKEIKERRKQSLPARLKAAGLEARLPSASAASSGTGTKTLLPVIPSLSSSAGTGTGPGTGTGKKSKVTRIKLLTNESNVKLTRRAQSIIE